MLAMMALGDMLKPQGMTSNHFLDTLDKLVYDIFSRLCFSEKRLRRGKQSRTVFTLLFI